MRRGQLNLILVIGGTLSMLKNQMKSCSSSVMIRLMMVGLKESRIVRSRIQLMTMSHPDRVSRYEHWYFMTSIGSYQHIGHD
jgi:hypothetical protein